MRAESGNEVPYSIFRVLRSVQDSILREGQRTPNVRGVTMLSSLVKRRRWDGLVEV